MDGAQQNNGAQKQVDGTQQNAQQQDVAQSAPQIDYSKISEIVNKGTQQKESAILKSFFEQNGMSPDEVQSAIATYKQNKAAEAEKQKNAAIEMQRENAELKAQILKSRIDAKATEIALDMGVDKNQVQYLVKMADMKNAVDEKGEISEENIKTAFEDVLKDVPALKAQNNNGSTGFKVGADNNQGSDQDNDELRKLFGLKPKK